MGTLNTTKETPGGTVKDHTVISDEFAKRSRHDVKVFGRALGNTAEQVFIDAELADPAPVVLSAAGQGSRLIEKVTSYPFKRQRGYVPVAPRITAELQPRNEAATFVRNEIKAPEFECIKVAALVSIDNDTVADIPATEEALNASLAAAVGQRIDHVIVNGGTDGDHTVSGMIGAGVTTKVAKIGHDEISDAVARVEDSGGTATAILARPSEISGIRKAVDGSKLDKLPALISIPDLTDGTVSIPAKTVIVADLGSVSVALRKNLEVFKSDTAPEAFDRDSSFIAGRARIGSVVLPDSARVQVITVG